MMWNGWTDCCDSHCVPLIVSRASSYLPVQFINAAWRNGVSSFIQTHLRPKFDQKKSTSFGNFSSKTSKIGQSSVLPRL